MQKDNQQVVSEQVSRMMRRAQHKLDYFNNRITRSRFVDLPSQRLIRTAEQQARWFADELASLSLELEEVEKQFVSQLQIRETEERDIRTLCSWLIHPEAHHSLRLEETLSPNEWHARIQRWMLEPDYYPFSVERHDGTLIGFMMMRRVGRARREVSARLEIHLIGSQWRHLGYGSEALRRYIDHLCKQVDLNDIRLAVACENAAAVRCYEKVGFRAVLMRRDADQDLFEMEITPGSAELTSADPLPSEALSVEEIPMFRNVLQSQLQTLRDQLTSAGS